MAFENLRKEKHLSLVTRRKDGRQVATPMWFIVEGERIYMRTSGSSGKVKRIRNDARVMLATCTARGRETGERLEALARIADPSMLEAVNRGLKQKYGFLKSIVDMVHRITGMRDYVVLELTHS